MRKGNCHLSIYKTTKPPIRFVCEDPISDGTQFPILFYLCASDMRKGNCYLNIYNTTQPPIRLVCEDPIGFNLVKKQCCCSVGKGWSVVDEQGCEPCPRPRTRMYHLFGTMQCILRLMEYCCQLSSLFFSNNFAHHTVIDFLSHSIIIGVFWWFHCSWLLVFLADEYALLCETDMGE